MLNRFVKTLTFLTVVSIPPLIMGLYVSTHSRIISGPVYVFEKILYQICLDQSWDYLSLRLWIGIWVGLILIVLVIFDASAVVCYITR